MSVPGVVLERPSLASRVRDWVMPAAVIVLGLVVGYDRFVGPITSVDDDPGQVAVDATAIRLGREYRTAFDAAGLAALDAVVASPGQTAADLARDQQDALAAGVRAAGSPVAAELTSRFGSMGSADPVAVRAFYRGLASGYRKGAK